MVSFDTAATIALVAVLSAAVLLNRKKLSFQRLGILYAAMYKTKVGLRAMDRIAQKYKWFFDKATPYIIAIGFIGMAVVTFDIARSLIMILTQSSTPTVGVVLPFKAKGIFYVPFLYWIISIFVILVIHEGMHGVMARVYGLPLKNSGLVILGVLIPLIPGAFVEPDEKKLTKAQRKKQLAVFAAGPVANIITGLMLMLLLFSVITPFTNTFYAKDGVIVTELMDGNPPAEQAGIEVGEKITMINGQAITQIEDFSQALSETKPGDTINLVTTEAVREVTLTENPQNKKAWLGVYVENPLKAPTWATHSVLWIKELIFWLALLSIGVGLFNLLPLGPIDGGRMLLTVLEKVTHQKHAHKIWKSVSFVLLGILITNIIIAFV